MNETHREYHPIASLFPLMDGNDFDALKADIAANGLREAIWLHQDGSILDGRNRHRACIETGTPPQFRTWSGSGSLIAFVVSLNLHRRHLTSSQRAVVALEILPMMEEEARERQGQRTDLTSVNKFTEVEPQRATQQAADIAQTNYKYVSDAKRLQTEAPDLLADVKRGDKSITKAKRELVRRQRREAPPLPSNKYRVLYADPPWSYGNAGVIGETDNYGHVARHYPAMTITELCEMGIEIKEITESNAVLFLWVTSPLLEECFPVIKAWGFKYKTSFVWDKIGHNFGHYNSVRHELLLVCTRGSCTPDTPKLWDSVQSIEKTRTHSEKPEEFRAIIDTLYTHGKRLELFARASAQGWETWGNEPEAT